MKILLLNFQFVILLFFLILKWKAKEIPATKWRNRLKASLPVITSATEFPELHMSLMPKPSVLVSSLLCCTFKSYMAQLLIENPLSQMIFIISPIFGICFAGINPNALISNKCTDKIIFLNFKMVLDSKSDHQIIKIWTNFELLTFVVGLPLFFAYDHLRIQLQRLVARKC